VPAELNLHLELEGAWAARARELCARLRALGNDVDLDACVPHATVYLATFPDDARPAVEAAVAELARRTSPIATRITGLRGAGRGYLFLDVERTPALETLHALALERLSPLRRGLVAGDIRELARKLPAREQALAEEHGFPWVAELYAPHVTIAKLPEENAARALELLGPASSHRGELTLATLALGESGAHGTVPRTLARERLRPRG
jgi:2'-5' RNA ligase